MNTTGTKATCALCGHHRNCIPVNTATEGVHAKARNRAMRVSPHSIYVCNRCAKKGKVVV